MLTYLDELTYYFSFPFVRYALIVGVLISLCSALFGVILVLKRFSFLADGLSHTAFGALAIATILNVGNQLYVVLPITAICAIILLKKEQSAKVKGDAALAMVSVGALAAGYIILNISSASTNVAGDVCGTLFGSTSILTLSKSDVVLSLVITAFSIGLFILFYNKIFSVTFDESFAESTGLSKEFYNTMIAIITAVIIVLAMKLVGSLLISALIVFPVLSAMRIFRSFKGTVICSAVISVLSAMFGILASVVTSIPVGPAVVVANIIFFALSLITEKLYKR